MGNGASTKHEKYSEVLPDWTRIRDSVAGESKIKSKNETYLPRPAGMSGEYADAYEDYKERAHFPLIASYALQGTLGVIITKLPEFNVPKELEYILKTATKDGLSIEQLFLDIIIDILQTGRVPVIIDIDDIKDEFRFVRYQAEDFINWKTEIKQSEKNLKLAVFTEMMDDADDIFSQDQTETQRVLTLDENGNYQVKVFSKNVELEEFAVTPVFKGNTIDEIPVFIAGSLNNGYDIQPIPLIAVANASIQIYRKEADLSNAEFLSCNPTLCATGVTNDEELPNVVGSSVLVSLSDPQARLFYTITDVAALTHVSKHINDLYEEAIRHGVALLEARKGVEAAEALRIRQAVQSSTIYSIYLSAILAITDALKLMCKWGGYDETKVTVDKPASLTQDIPDATIISEVITGYLAKTIPLQTIHRYMVNSGLIDQTISFEDYVKQLNETHVINSDPLNTDVTEKKMDSNGNEITEGDIDVDKKKTDTKATGTQDVVEE
jgi:hypothetical protein